MDWTNKTIIVTGGAQGIGMAVTAAFAGLGGYVVIADVDAEAGEEHAGALSGQGHSARFIETDVADGESVASMIESVAESGRGIDVLVNNAGIMDVQPMAERPMAAWDRILAVNLRGAYLCARAAVAHMPEGSAIIQIASTRAYMSEPDTEPYAASKGGLLALTHALAVSLAPRRIRVNAVSPGWIDVTAWKKRSARRDASLSDQDHAQHPVGRVGRPDDIARACLFLADGEQSGFIMGQNLVIDGGMTVKMIYEE